MSEAAGGAEFFARSYREARAGFLATAEAAHAELHAQPHPLLGRDGEALALDVAWDGPRDAADVLVVSSGCHGIEGYCGSGIQRALLADADFRAEARRAGIAVVHLHALNPWGFSWWRRVTQENVDLNRNFHDFAQPLPANPGYEELAPFLVPPTWPPSDAVEKTLADWAAAHGPRAFQAAVTGGQHTHPEGLFHGGRNPTWSQVALRHVLREQFGRARRIAWIDVHTGLGPSGVGERIFAGHADDAGALQRGRAWWGAVTSIYDGSSTSARLSGMMFGAIYDECPQAEYTGMALEYGTLPMDRMLHALRADQWLENHPEADAPTRTAIKQQIFDAFFVDTPEWKARILAQGRADARAALHGLAAR
jgi:hypothetical protein